ncbi:hypothetical protein NDU88_005234 [Pleurodeles waltl]|uniref:Uncharacterized protein n=1 Tax=Pleurodeles waltl TaxID=8319 RepID=A0AAV7RHX9_PLEWA|nr:hypothetical protein NDU88_005234 [Pleurodeles waltl]
MARASTVSAPRSAGHLFQHTLSLQHRRSLRAVSQERVVVGRPPICPVGLQPRSGQLHHLSARSSGHLFQRTLSLQHRRGLRVIFQEPAVANWPPICTAGRTACTFTVSAPRSSSQPRVASSHQAALRTRLAAPLRLSVQGPRRSPTSPRTSAHCSTVPIPPRDPSGAIKERISSRSWQSSAFTCLPLLPLRPRPSGGR